MDLEKLDFFVSGIAALEDAAQRHGATLEEIATRCREFREAGPPPFNAGELRLPQDGGKHTSIKIERVFLGIGPKPVWSAEVSNQTTGERWTNSCHAIKAEYPIQLQIHIWAYKP